MKYYTKVKCDCWHFYFNLSILYASRTCGPTSMKLDTGLSIWKDRWRVPENDPKLPTASDIKKAFPGSRVHDDDRMRHGRHHGLEHGYRLRMDRSMSSAVTL